MLNRIGEFIIDGGWSTLWEFVRVPIFGGVVYAVLLVISYLIGKGV